MYYATNWLQVTLLRIAKRNSSIFLVPTSASIFRLLSYQLKLALSDIFPQLVAEYQHTRSAIYSPFFEPLI